MNQKTIQKLENLKIYQDQIAEAEAGKVDDDEEKEDNGEFTQEQKNEIIVQKNRGKDAEWIARYYILDVDKVQEVIDSLDEDDVDL